MYLCVCVDRVGYWGTRWHRWLRYCATSRRPRVRFPMWFFRTHYDTGVDLASNRNEYQCYLMGEGVWYWLPVCVADNGATRMCRKVFTDPCVRWEIVANYVAILVYWSHCLCYITLCIRDKLWNLFCERGIMTTEHEGHYCIGRLFVRRFLCLLIFNVHQIKVPLSWASSTWW